MSSVFKSPKVKAVPQKVVEPETVDNNETIFELEKKRKKKMGAVSQILAQDRSENESFGNKRTLGA
jgi:hypothetical protein